MCSKLILGFALVAFFGVQLAQSSLFGPIDGSLPSTLRIITKLCWPGNHNDNVAKAFTDCYDQAPGKDQFFECQNAAFGHLMDTQDHITDACMKVIKMKPYADCVKEKLVAAQINAEDAITKVNICQGNVLGL